MIVITAWGRIVPFHRDYLAPRADNPGFSIFSNIKKYDKPLFKENCQRMSKHTGRTEGYLLGADWVHYFTLFYFTLLQLLFRRISVISKATENQKDIKQAFKRTDQSPLS